jgi:hypothetical protein
MSGISSESQLDPGQISSASRSIVTYDARGNRVAVAYEQQLFGALSFRSETTGTADARGLFPERTTTVDNDGDGSVDSRQIGQSNFDANGNPVSSTTSLDNDNDGVIDSRYSFTDSFDVNGRLQTELLDSDTNADGVIDLHAVTTVAPDGLRAVVRTVTQDDGVDGVIDDRSTTRWVYDAAGNNTSITFLDERGPDYTVYGSGTFTMTYDGDNRLLSRTRVQAFEVGGVPYSIDSSTNEYDARGNLLKVTQEYSNQLGGGPGRLVVDYEYGANGERTMFRYGTDFDSDGVIDFESTTQVTNQQFDDGVLALAQQYFDFAGAISLDYTGGVVGITNGNFATN